MPAGSPTDDLRPGAEQLGISLSPTQLDLFRRYHELLIQWNARVNLISRRDVSRIVTHHFLDSLGGLRFLPGGGKLRVVDVGAGAGFPGLPLKICRPNIAITLVESIRKKVLFLQHIVRQLDLTNVVVVNERAEQLANSPGLDGLFDVAVVRAVGSLADLVALCFPLLRPRGMLVAYKGPEIKAEVMSLEKAKPPAKPASLRIEPVTVPVANLKRSIVILTKA
jgi:16S rRNA (guanine527-N7)-methyltransferase